MCRTIVWRFLPGVLGLAGLLAPPAGGANATEPMATPLERRCAAEGVTGGLCVLVACHDVRSAAGLGATGRYLVHVLESDLTAIERMRTDLHQQGVYGLASVDQLAPDNTLPYTENLVNAAYEPETWLERPFLRPLAVFRDNTLYGGSQDRRTVFRRDFRLEAGEQFDTTWVGQNVFDAKYGRLWRSQLLARGAAWNAVPFPLTEGKQAVSALMLAGDSLYAASSRGGLAVVDARTGELRKRLQTPPAAWDGLAAAEGRVFLSTQDGRVVCLGQVKP